MTETLTKAQKLAAEAAMTKLIEAKTSFFELYRAANVAAGFAEFDQRTPCYRLADRFLQKQRKAGKIVPHRYGGAMVWSPVPPGASL